MSKKASKHANGDRTTPASAKPEQFQPAAKSVKALVVGKDFNYARELRRLEIERVKFEEWIRERGLEVVALFEGRDAAGKGGAIKRITERLNPRVCRVVALGIPTEREKTEWYFQR